MPRKQRKVDSGLRWGEGSTQKRITQGGDERWVARWPEGEGPDKVWRGKTFATEDEAEDHLRSIVRRKRAGTYQPETRMTVAECVNEYIERKRPGWAPGTYATATVYVKRAILPYLGDKRIVQLTSHDVQRWLDTLAKSGRRSKSGKVTGGMGHSTIVSSRSILSRAIGDAVRLGIIPHNVVTDTEAGGKRADVRPTWTAEEAARVIEQVSGHAMHHAIYAVMLSTGMRQGELRALHWRDIDLTTGIITIRATIARDESFREQVGSTTKTRSQRRVRIDPEIVEILRDHRKDQLARRLRHPHWHDTDLVFDRSDGRYIPQATLQELHERTVVAAGVPKIRWHDLRHTYASLQAAAGVSARSVMDALGHKRLTITLERYTHVSDEMQREAARTIARQLFPPSDATTSHGEEAKSG